MKRYLWINIIMGMAALWMICMSVATVLTIAGTASAGEIDCLDGCVLPDPGIGSSVRVYGTIEEEADVPRIYGTIEIDCIDGCVLPDPGVAEAGDCVDGCVLPDE